MVAACTFLSQQLVPFLLRPPHIYLLKSNSHLFGLCSNFLVFNFFVSLQPGTGALYI